MWDVGGGRRKNVRKLRCPLVILTHRQKHKRVRERSKGASLNLTKHKDEVQRITTKGRKAAWVDDL